ncbi:hypothetical protein QCA50_009674 [Cerrena zonata]|uniref:S-adenosyl-L-methionine-dependent methyltransferase n=1 Tax=Cerrena zonata TaxID=2478898 RepID=A0AAW0G7P6_9APHY
MPRISHLLSSLSSALGPASARLEFKWMKQAAEQSDKGTSLVEMVERRLCGEPLQYIIGTQPFGSLELLVRPPTLIPRPETEDWTLRLAELVDPSPDRPISLLDMCTGSGCIPLLLCHTWRPGSVNAYGVDISADAIKLARDNAERCGIHVPTVTYGHSSSSFNTFKPLLGNIRDASFIHSLKLKPPFNVITSNPPYITRREFKDLPPSVRDYEDHRALLGDPDISEDELSSHLDKGLTFYRIIARLIANQGILADDGIVALEIGSTQANDVGRIMQREGRLNRIDVWKDPWDKDRVVLARR